MPMIQSSTQSAVQKSCVSPIMTAGIDGIYPKGIPIARVGKSDDGKGLFKNVQATPTVDFSRLEDVLIIRTKKIPPEVARYEP